MCSVFNVNPYVFTVLEAQPLNHDAKVIKLVVRGWI